MACKNCNSTWTPRGNGVPTDLEAWYQRALDPVYADSGIQRHLPTLREYAESVDHIVELGIGGGDQGTLALLATKPATLDSYDINEPASLPTLRKLADQNNIEFTFHQGDTGKAQPIASELLFVDTWHAAPVVAKELELFAPLCARYIIAHDVVTFGHHGQGGESDTGIVLAFGDFLMRNPEWRVVRMDEYDNGLLILARA